jgi:hypothetical protein
MTSRSFDELAPAVGREADHVPAAVLRIAPALDEAFCLEVVEDADELAAVDAEDVGDRRLGLAVALPEQGQEAVLVGLEAHVLERPECLRLQHQAELGEQEASAREQLARHAGRQLDLRFGGDR